jgi:hypothetical protein
VLTAFIINAIAMMMKAMFTPETSVNFYQTWRNIPEGNYPNTRRRENLKSRRVFSPGALILTDVFSGG